MPSDLTPTECAHVLRALADPTRLRILAMLQAGPCSVSEVLSALDIPQYQASRHLGALASLGLVVRERRGKYVFYALAEGVSAAASAEVELGCCRLSVPRPDLAGG